MRVRAQSRARTPRLPRAPISATSASSRQRPSLNARVGLEARRLARPPRTRSRRGGWRRRWPARGDLLHRPDEPVSATRHRLNVGGRLGESPSALPQIRDRPGSANCRKPRRRATRRMSSSFVTSAAGRRTSAPAINQAAATRHIATAAGEPVGCGSSTNGPNKRREKIFKKKKKKKKERGSHVVGVNSESAAVTRLRPRGAGQRGARGGDETRGFVGRVGKRREVAHLAAGARGRTCRRGAV